MLPTPSLTRWVIVRLVVEGFHRWPEAPPNRAYLATTHRHLFHLELSVEVEHNDRAIEFHDLRDWAVHQLPPGDYGAASCEALAERLLGRLAQQYHGRRFRVAVFEDGECGALLEAVP